MILPLVSDSTQDSSIISEEGLIFFHIETSLFSASGLGLKYFWF